MVSLQLWVKTGSLHEGAYLGSGISHYIEHLVFKGTKRRTGPMINRAIHALGGSINAYTTLIALYTILMRLQLPSKQR